MNTTNYFTLFYYLKFPKIVMDPNNWLWQLMMRKCQTERLITIVIGLRFYWQIHDKFSHLCWFNYFIENCISGQNILVGFTNFQEDHVMGSNYMSNFGNSNTLYDYHILLELHLSAISIKLIIYFFFW